MMFQWSYYMTAVLGSGLSGECDLFLVSLEQRSHTEM